LTCRQHTVASGWVAHDFYFQLRSLVYTHYIAFRASHENQKPLNTPSAATGRSVSARPARRKPTFDNAAQPNMHACALVSPKPITSAPPTTICNDAFALGFFSLTTLPRKAQVSHVCLSCLLGLHVRPSRPHGRGLAACVGCRRFGCQLVLLFAVRVVLGIESAALLLTGGSVR
jgi:hypothetical protein